MGISTRNIVATKSNQNAFKGSIMQAASSQPNDNEKLLIWGQKVGVFVLYLAKGTYHLGQELRGVVKHLAQQSKLIEELKLRSEELAELKQKMAALESGAAELEALKTQLYSQHCRMVILESGRKLIQSRAR
jgi:cell shape-determining protein MreC